MKKVILVVVLVIFLSLIFVGASMGYENMVPRIPTVDELNLSDLIDRECTGLFYYEGDEARSVLEDDLDIDPDKPMVIFTHGMHHGGGYNKRFNFSEREIWQQKGYNAFVFRWSQFSDDLSFLGIENKIWTRGDHEIAYENELGDREIGKCENCPPLAEIFLSYYNEFMTNYDINAAEIRLMGHSMGGDLTMGVSSYVKTMMEKGALERRFMLTRVVLLDPYVASISHKLDVPWLDEPIGEEGSGKLYAGLINEYKQLGIPIEYILTGYADIGLNREDKDLLKETAAYLSVDCSFVTGAIVDAIADCHQVAIDWYNESMEYTYMDETADDTNFALAASTPTPFVIGQYGGNYAMKKNTTPSAFDDVVYSQDLKGAQIAGYAFRDKNNNGIMDDTFASRTKGVYVRLYADGALISTKETNEGGFYKFKLDSSFVGKELQIVTEGVTPTTISQEDIHYSYKNSIGQNLKSDKFVLNHTNQIIIKNIGIK